MRDLWRLWRTFESMPALAGVEVEWSEHLGDELEAVRRFLRPEQERATTYPCPDAGGESCPRRVVVHAPDDIVAVCGNSPRECESVPLKPSDIVVYRFDLAAFAATIAKLLHLDGARGEGVEGLPNVRTLGTCALEPGRVAQAFLVTGAEPEGSQAVELLMARHPATRLLFVRTARKVLPTVRAVLDARGCLLLPAADVAAWDIKKGLVAKVAAGELLAPLRRTPVSPAQTAERAHESSADYHARAIAYSHEWQGKELTADEYEALLSKAASFEVFVNGCGATYQGSRRGAKKRTEFDFTAAEAEMLAGYVRRAATKAEPCRPRAIGVTQQSADAARKTFTRMRQKVDVPLTGQQWQLFTQRRVSDGGRAEYSFAPGTGVRFCILLPPK